MGDDNDELDMNDFNNVEEACREAVIRLIVLSFQVPAVLFLYVYNYKRSYMAYLMEQGANVKKHFKYVIYKFSYQARVFVRITWKRLLETNTLA